MISKKTKTLPTLFMYTDQKMSETPNEMSQFFLKSTTLLASWIESIMGQFQNFEKNDGLENFPPN